MKDNPKILSKFVIPLLVALVFVFSFSVPARAEGIITDGQVPAGQTVENDAIAFGDEVIIDGSVDGDLIAFGGKVEINGDVGGSLITFGRDITINGNVAGSVYSLGVNMNLGPSSAIDRSFYFGGIRLNTAEGSSIDRDMVVASLTAQLAGQPGRDLNAMIGLLQFIDIIREGVEDEIESQDIPIPSQESEENSNQGNESGNTRAESTFVAYQPDFQHEINQYLLPKTESVSSPAAHIDTSRIQNEQPVTIIASEKLFC